MSSGLLRIKSPPIRRIPSSSLRQFHFGSSATAARVASSTMRVASSSATPPRSRLAVTESCVGWIELSPGPPNFMAARRASTSIGGLCSPAPVSRSAAGRGLRVSSRAPSASPAISRYFGNIDNRPAADDFARHMRVALAVEGAGLAQQRPRAHLRVGAEIVDQRGLQCAHVLSNSASSQATASLSCHSTWQPWPL